jgi:hypothetical protein
LETVVFKKAPSAGKQYWVGLALGVEVVGLAVGDRIGIVGFNVGFVVVVGLDVVGLVVGLGLVVSHPSLV